MDLQFPVGKYTFPELTTAEQRRAWIEEIRLAPSQLRAAVERLGSSKLDSPYRPGGWTVRQVVHHVPESHMNSYMRFKWALTENEPTIKPYDEAAWALTPDVATTPIEVSLTLLEALHARWVNLLTAMSEADFHRHMVHPEIGRIRLDGVLGLYAWHGRHHVAHVNQVRPE